MIVGEVAGETRKAVEGFVDSVPPLLEKAPRSELRHREPPCVQPEVDSRKSHRRLIAVQCLSP